MSHALPESIVSGLMIIPVGDSDRKDWSVKTFQDVAPGDVLVVSSGDEGSQSIVKLALVFRGEATEAMCFTMIASQDAYDLQTVEEALEAVEHCSVVLLRRGDIDAAMRQKFEELHKSPPRDFVKLFLSVVGLSLNALSGKEGSPCMLLLDALLGAGYVAGPAVRKVVAEVPIAAAAPFSLSDLFSADVFAAPTAVEEPAKDPVEEVRKAEPLKETVIDSISVLASSSKADEPDDAPLKGKAQISSALPSLLTRLEHHMEQSSKKISEHSVAQAQHIAETASKLTAKLQTKVADSLNRIGERSELEVSAVNSSVDAILGELHKNDQLYSAQLHQKLAEYKQQLEEVSAEATGELDTQLSDLAEKVKMLQMSATDALSKVPSNSTAAVRQNGDDSRSDSQLCIEELCQTFKDTLQTKISRYTGHLSTVTGEEVEELERLLQEIKDETVLQESAMKSSLDVLIATHSKRATGQKLSEMKVALRSLHNELVEEFSQSNETLSNELAAPLRELAATCRRELESAENKLTAKQEALRSDMRGDVDIALEKINATCTDVLKNIRTRYAACLQSMEARSTEIARLAGSSALNELLEGHAPADYLTEKLRRSADANFEAFVGDSEKRVSTVRELADVLCSQTKHECQLQLNQTESKARTVISNIRKRLSAIVTEINQAQARCLEGIDLPS